MNWFDTVLIVSSGTGFLSLVGMGLCILSMNKRYRVWKYTLNRLLLGVAVVSMLTYMSQVITIVIGMVSKG